MILKFFLKVFSLSLFLLVVFWFFYGITYQYRYAKGGQTQSNIVLPQPAAVETLVKDTNFLLLGMSGKPYAAPYLTDTIIVGQFKAHPSRVALTSIPRDLMVRVPGGNELVKINSLYSIGRTANPQNPVSLIQQKIEEISGLTIEYYAIIDVAGLEKIIDAFGGVEVELTKAINDPAYPGPNYSYEPFYLTAGLHHLNGHEAVRFARSRHSARGDFDRIERQQQLLNKLKEKIFSRPLSLEESLALYQNLNDHLATNVGAKDIPSFLATVFTMEGMTIKTHAFDNAAGGMLRSDKTSSGAYILLPRAGFEKYTEIQTFFSSSL